MSELNDLIWGADWTRGKHVSVIECPDMLKACEYFPVKVPLGNAGAHLNTTERHIRLIQLYFLPAAKVNNQGTTVGGYGCEGEDLLRQLEIHTPNGSARARRAEPVAGGANGSRGAEPEVVRLSGSSA